MPSDIRPKRRTACPARGARSAVVWSPDRPADVGGRPRASTRVPIRLTGWCRVLFHRVISRAIRSGIGLVGHKGFDYEHGEQGQQNPGPELIGALAAGQGVLQVIAYAPGRVRNRQTIHLAECGLGDSIEVGFRRIEVSHDGSATLDHNSGSMAGSRVRKLDGHPAGLGQAIGEVAHELVYQGEVKAAGWPSRPTGCRQAPTAARSVRVRLWIQLATGDWLPQGQALEPGDPAPAG